MARYIVVRVDKNQTADELLKRFSVVPAIEVVGVFASGTSFCPGKVVCGEDRTYRRHSKYGTLHCSVCKLPVTSAQQSPTNLLYEELNLHPRMFDFRISVWEPLEHPVKKYGQRAIDAKNAQAETGKNRLKRHKAKKRREERQRNEQSS